MLFHKYVVWRLANDAIDLKYILWKEKYKLLWQGFKDMTKSWYTYWIAPLNEENLYNFYHTLYKEETEKKNNAKVTDLIEKYKDRIKKEDIQFAYIKHNDILLAGGIFINRIEENNTIYNLWFRSYEKMKINWLYLWYYIEYLFYEHSLKNKVDFLSRGRDRNCYGALWSAIWLAIHKLQYKFSPYCLWKDNPKVSIDEKNIKADTLIFTEPNKDNIYTKAVLYTNKTHEEIKKQFAVIEKRWISLEIKNIPSIV